MSARNAVFALEMTTHAVPYKHSSQAFPIAISFIYWKDCSAFFKKEETRDNFGETEFLQLWESSNVEFFNGYTPGFGSWNGFSWSKVTDTTTPGFANQYASFTGGGSDGAGGTITGTNYAVGFGNQTFFNLPEAAELQSIDVTNTTYALHTSRTGRTATCQAPWRHDTRTRQRRHRCDTRHACVRNTAAGTRGGAWAYMCLGFEAAGTLSSRSCPTSGAVMGRSVPSDLDDVSNWRAKRLRSARRTAAM